MKISIFGSGYVGLVTAACLAEVGHEVKCFDILEDRISSLKKNKVPIFEPGLAEILKKNSSENRLSFTSEIDDVLNNPELIFIAVGTPQNEKGSTDLSSIKAVATSIGQNLLKDTVICVKSTVPVGTTDTINEIINSCLRDRKLSIKIDVCFNPEFLKEGDAINDFNRPARIIIGHTSEHTKNLLTECYRPFNRKVDRMIYMDIKSAELSKYAANAMLASRISFMSEISQISSRMGIDIENIRIGIGSDPRIGDDFIYPGCGYGGSCFPKDVRSLINESNLIGYTPLILEAIEQVNNNQKNYIPDIITKLFHRDFKDKIFTLWGLAFKPGTDDIREAPSIEIIKFILSRGGKLNLYDPEALGEIKKIFQEGNIQYFEEKYKALEGSSALIIPTEWSEFKNINFETLRTKMKKRIIIDGRNIFNPESLIDEGIEYYGVSRGNFPFAFNKTP